MFNQRSLQNTQNHPLVSLSTVIILIQGPLIAHLSLCHFMKISNLFSVFLWLDFWGVSIRGGLWAFSHRIFSYVFICINMYVFPLEVILKVSSRVLDPAKGSAYLLIQQNQITVHPSKWIRQNENRNLTIWNIFSFLVSINIYISNCHFSCIMV